MEARNPMIEQHVSEQTAPREVEMKLELASGRMDDLLDHPLLARAKPAPDRSGTLFAVYYDTVDHALRRARLSLRIRSSKGHQVQTIKAENGDSGLALDRAEWERDVDGRLDFAAAAETPLAPFIGDIDGRRLIRPAFTVETNRRVFLIEHAGAVIELALDQVVATAGSQNSSFSELELELKEGKASGLFDLAGKLAEAAALRLSLTTKSERGYALTGAAASRPSTSGEIALSSSTPCAEAFQRIARSCLSQIVGNEALFRRTRDASALHQTRVGFRRLKACLSLFKRMLGNRETETIKAELRWAGRQLGPARDLDVLLANVPATKVQDVQLERMNAERARTEAYDALLETLASPRFTRAILKTAAWIETGRWLTRGKAATRRRSIADHAAKELPRRWKPIRKGTKRLAALEPDRRHGVRIKAKKLRYIAEFLESLFGQNPAKKRHAWWLARLKRLQDALGEMNDIAVASERFPALSRSNPKQRKTREKKLLSRAEKTARKLRRAEPFWV
ncbi:CHAD domain-containing protein [Microvirga sp. TS319]|uniref:CYTH and CHAD domain-containing protein n=1 Tax=Microvirga sp. TS319 TaxID=3241165 RepID=UPI003519F7AF